MTTTEENARAVRHLPHVSYNLMSEAKITLQKIAQEKARHAAALANLNENFALTCWNTVKSQWTPDEIAAALATPTTL